MKKTLIAVMTLYLGLSLIFAQAGQCQQARPGTQKQDVKKPEPPKTEQKTQAIKPGVQPAASNTPFPQPSELKVEREFFIYNTAGRRDPFLSIIIATQQAERKKIDIRKFVHPLEKYDISQVRLIAIIWNKVNSYATVGLPDGKYYTVREGMKIGVNNGKVAKIAPDAVIVKEMVKDYRGDIKPKDRTLKLR